MNKIGSILRKDIISWSLYDFANTIYSMNILSLYFKRWVVEDLGKEGLYYDIAFSASMLLAGLIMPALGAFSDYSQKKRMFLLLFTLMCCTAIGFIPALPSGLFFLAIIFFGFSNFFYEGAMVFYNSLLYSVSSGVEARLVSGLGVAVGYLGSIVGMLLVLPFINGDIFGWNIPFISAGGKMGTFLPTAIFFLLFAIPIFIWVKEPAAIRSTDRRQIKKAYKDVWIGIKDTKKYPGVLRFLIADYFFEDAVATVILNIGLYSSIVIGFNDADLTIFLIVSTISAMFGSFIIGRLSQRRSLKKMMRLIIYGWIVVLFLFIIIENIFVVYIMGSLVGVLLGGLWTVSRPLLAEMVPKEELGKFFGLYSLSGRAAAVIGPLIWGTLVYLFNPSRPLGEWATRYLALSPSTAVKLPYWLAVISLAVLMSFGLIIFRKVPDRSSQN